MGTGKTDTVVRVSVLLATGALLYGLAVDILTAVHIEVFMHLFVGRTSLFLAFFSACAMLFFFIAFAIRYLEYGLSRLKMATFFVIGGASLMLLLHIKGFAIHFNLYSWASVFRFSYLEPFIPWFNSLLLLVFFIVFHLEMALQKQTQLARATMCGIVSSAISFLMRCGFLFFYVNTGTFRWFSELPQAMRIALLPVNMIGHGLLLCFFIIFWRELRASPDGA
jgi:hypothetical protein